MAGRYLTDLADVARRTGYRVIEVGAGRNQTGTQWQYRARSSGGYGSGRPNHVMIHHTASGPSADGWGDVNYMCFSAGNPNKPTANLYISRVPEIYVMAGGATNTNGVGFDPCGVTPNNQMNTAAIAVEAGNNGVGEPWNEAMLDCYVKLTHYLCEAYGIPNHCIHGHAEWTRRKIDPAGPPKYASGAQTWDMHQFRSDVAGGVTSPPVEPPPTEPPPSSTGVFTVNGYRKDVRQGSQGKMAKMCQQQINLISGQGIAEDGNFGNQSVGALKNVQAVLGVPSDGWCGQQTWQAFENGIKKQADGGDWD